MGRVAITGVGVISAIGHCYEDFVAGLAAGTDGLVGADDDDAPALFARIAEVRGWSSAHDEGIADDLVGSARRCEQLALDAAHQAVDRSDLRSAGLGATGVGVFVGTCQGFVGELSSYQRMGANLAVSHVADDLARQLGFRGPAITTTNACSASGAAIALGYDQIRRGRLGAVVAGGADAVAVFTVAGFSSLRSLDPLGCSPYGRSEGLSIGEGAGFVVLEDLDAARRRGAPVIVELAGAGMSADAYHPTAPDPTGRGAILAVERALASGGLGVAQVGYVNGHGTGTQANDSMERTAFRVLFGDRRREVPISSTKSQIGHTLGAAGVLEAAACIAAVADGVLPPTLRQPSAPDADGFDFVATPGRRVEVDVAVSVNYAFGGSNSALVIADPSVGDALATTPTAPQPCVITGIGVVGALGLGLESWIAAVEDGAFGLAPCEVAPGRTILAGPLPPVAKRFASGTTWRKMDEFERATVASAQLAWKDAQLRLGNDRQQEVAVVFATQTGSVGSIVAFSEQAMLGIGADPALFPHTAINAASGHVCTTMGLRGPNLSISSGGASSLSALETAAALIERGAVEVALVCSTDDLPVSALARFPRADQAGEGLGAALTLDVVRPFDPDADGAAPGGAAVTLVLESEAHAAARQAPRWARVASTALVVAERSSTGRVDGWSEAYRVAATAAGVATTDIDLCFAAAMGIVASDRDEAAALARVLAPDCRVSAPKSIVGECIGTSGAVGVVFAALALRDGIVLPNRGLRGSPADGLRHVRDLERGVEIGTAAVGVASGSGSYGVVILESAR